MSEIPFDISMPTAQIDEEGLLPGIAESTSTTGYLITALQPGTSQFAFAPLADQHFLENLHLQSQGQDLHYTLSENHLSLTAMAGEAGPTVFTLQLDPKGIYTFTLHEHIDRAPAQNLITDNLQNAQNISTEPHSPYQLTFYYQPNNIAVSHIEPLKVFWDNQLLHTISPHQEAKGYTFSVEGNAQTAHTQLSFSGVQPELLDNILHQVSVTSTAQKQLPIDFAYLQTEGDNTSLHHFGVNVTTTPSIQLSSQIPFDVMYEQSVYQTIVVNDQNASSNPLHTIHLDTLFDNLSIDPQNRMVAVVQLQQNGEGTNVYEVQISDKTDPLAPITVADIQLSFPGGNGGLSVFERNVSIEEGSVLPPISHDIFT